MLSPIPLRSYKLWLSSYYPIKLIQHMTIYTIYIPSISYKTWLSTPYCSYNHVPTTCDCLSPNPSRSYNISLSTPYPIKFLQHRIVFLLSIPSSPTTYDCLPPLPSSSYNIQLSLTYPIKFLQHKTVCLPPIPSSECNIWQSAFFQFKLKCYILTMHTSLCFRFSENAVKLSFQING